MVFSQFERNDNQEEEEEEEEEEEDEEAELRENDYHDEGMME